jgi:hypothetical protein
MASKRHLRKRSCESKIKHVDEISARRHARSLGSEHVPYPCHFCGEWHIGRPNKSKRQSLAAKARNRRI